MNVPIYKIDLHENSYYLDNKKTNTKNKSSINYLNSKDSCDSNLFSQESQLNASCTSIDKNESFWQSLRNLWSHKNNDSDVKIDKENINHKKIISIMKLLDGVEKRLCDVNSKLEELESAIKSLYDKNTQKTLRGILKSGENLKRSYEKSNAHCTDILSNLKVMKSDTNTNTIAFNSIIESIETNNSKEYISNLSSTEILNKFQSILQNCLSDLSGEILMQWNDVLYNIYSNSSVKSKRSNKKCKQKIVDLHKSPGDFLINSLRRSERLQNKNETGLNSLNKEEMLIIKAKRFENVNDRSINKIKSPECKKQVVKQTYKSRPIKRSVEIFKYYEESRSETSKEEIKINTPRKIGRTIILNQNSKRDRKVDSQIDGTSNYDSDIDLVSLRKLFNC